MWRSRAKSAVRIHHTSSPFSCSSFKDIQNLCVEDPTPASAAKKPSIFHRVRVTTTVLRTWSTRLPHPLSLAKSEPSILIPGAEKRIVVYFTSLRVVRPTFEDCKTVRFILRGFHVSIDERDLSMDSAFINELQGILGQRKLTLPRVFIGGRYIGGAEEVKQLNEIGELKKIVEGLPAEERGLCDTCGGYRFVLCDHCHGSRKLYSDKCGTRGGFRSCTACNENGLIRCPYCSCAPF